MAKCIFENLTAAEAKMLAEWYAGQGEQDAIEWFEIHDLKAPMTDVLHKGSYKKVMDNGDVIVYCVPNRE